MPNRPSFIRHHSAIESGAGKGDLYCVLAPFGKALGLDRLGINLETMPPGTRSSQPHAHSHEEEFVFVVEGRPEVWIDGEVHALAPGDGVAFPAGTGIAHCFINNSDAPVKLLIVGERNPLDRAHYPLNPERQGEKPWPDVPQHKLGPADPHPHPPRAAR